MTKTADSRLVITLTFAVFVTGFAALLYQVTWQRMLGLFSGSDVRSVTIVASAFLAGLGVGSLTGSFFADRLGSRRAIQVFSFCQLAIGIFAFLSRFLYYNLLFLEWGELVESPAVLLIIVFISLLLPTTLMGLSMPLLSKAVVRSIQNAPQIITRLYAANTFGAGAGTFVSGWVLLGTFGYAVTVYLGAALSLLVGLTAFTLAWRFRQGDRAEVNPASPPITLRSVPRGVWTWCFLVFVSGFIVISLEVIWFRILDVTLRSNAYTFAHLLTFFLVGDAAGSFVGSRLVHRIQNPRRAFLWLQGLIALYSVAVVWGIALAATRYPLADYIRGSSVQIALVIEDNLIQWFAYLGLPSAMLLPPAFLIGFYFPVAQKAVQTDPQVVGQRVGLLEVSNIAGNALGGILTGLILLHFLGTARSLQIIGILGLIFVLVLLRENFSQFGRGLRLASGGLAAALLVIIAAFPSSKALWANLHAQSGDQFFIVAEDSTGVSAIKEQNQIGLLYANGQHQGDFPFTELHSFLGALPALLHPEPRNVLVIGIGSAGTPYAVGLNPKIEHILAVEIIGSELDVLEEYARLRDAEGLERLLADPRYEIRVGDGRRELALSETQFDIIEADAIRTAASHSGLLYSREYFEAAREKLADGGIMAQWNPTERVTATFVEVFPYVIQVDFLLLGSNDPIVYDPAALREKLNDPEIIAYLQAGGIDVTALREKIQPPQAQWTPDTPRNFPADHINTDLFPRDEYFLNNPS